MTGHICGVALTGAASRVERVRRQVIPLYFMGDDLSASDMNHSSSDKLRTAPLSAEVASLA